MTAGLDRPSARQVRVHEEDLSRINETGPEVFRRRRIGMIFQSVNLIDALPAINNVALAAQLTGTPGPSGPAPGAGIAGRTRILVHMIAETQRHAGHADIVRELIDGTAGQRLGSDSLPPGDSAWWETYRSRLPMPAIAAHL